MDHLQFTRQEQFPAGASPDLAARSDWNRAWLEQADYRRRDIVILDNSLKNQSRDDGKVDPAKEGPFDLADCRKLLT